MDPISDMLIRIKNAGAVGNLETDVPFSKMKQEIATVLQKSGYIKGFSQKGKKTNKRLVIELAYSKDKYHKIENLERVSKPSRRIYSGVREMASLRKGLGIVVISTPKGLLTGEEAKKGNVGGEVLFRIW